MSLEGKSNFFVEKDLILKGIKEYVNNLSFLNLKDREFLLKLICKKNYLFNLFRKGLTSNKGRKKIEIILKKSLEYIKKQSMIVPFFIMVASVASADVSSIRTYIKTHVDRTGQVDMEEGRLVQKITEDLLGTQEKTKKEQQRILIFGRDGLIFDYTGQLQQEISEKKVPLDINALKAAFYKASKDIRAIVNIHVEPSFNGDNILIPSAIVENENGQLQGDLIVDMVNSMRLREKGDSQFKEDFFIEVIARKKLGYILYCVKWSMLGKDFLTRKNENGVVESSREFKDRIIEKGNAIFAYIYLVDKFFKDNNRYPESNEEIINYAKNKSYSVKIKKNNGFFLTIDINSFLPIIKNLNVYENIPIVKWYKPNEGDLLQRDLDLYIQ